MVRKKHALLIHFEEELYEQLRVTGFEQRLSMTHIVNKVMREYFRKQLKKRAKKYMKGGE